MFDLDRSIERVRQCQCLPENDLRELCELVKGLLIEEATVQSLSSPRIVCGDIHGQFY
ncbi:MAG: Serine/threonine-protein phosphatase 6 catalytic subunit, partial [Cercozoa sp. M6MM]